MIRFRSLAAQQLLIIGVLLLPPSVAGAQRASTLSTGVRVRVVAPAVLTAAFEGRIVALAADTVLLTGGNGVLGLALARRDVATVAVSEGRPRGQRAIRGGAIGLVTGAVLGAYLLNKEAPGTFAGLVGLFAGGVVGAPTGAVVGAIRAPEQWGPARPLAAFER